MEYVIKPEEFDCFKFNKDVVLYGILVIIKELGYPRYSWKFNVDGNFTLLIDDEKKFTVPLAFVADDENSTGYRFIFPIGFLVYAKNKISFNIDSHVNIERIILYDSASIHLIK